MAIAELSPPTSDAPPKRRPGRPKGSKNKPKSPVDEWIKQEGGNGDAAPGGGGTRPRRKRVSKKVTEDIEAALAEMLTAPSMLAAFMQDEWAIRHFIVTGKELAHRIAVVSERHSQLRMYCEKLLEGESMAVLALGMIAYIVPPLIHYNIIPGPDGMMGVPRRPKGARKRQRNTGRPSDGTEWGDGMTEQQQYESAMRAEAEAAQAAGEYVPDSGIEFTESDTEPPTFTDAN